MLREICFGSGEKISGSWEPLQLVAECHCRRGLLGTQLESVVRETLANPMGCPPLTDWVIPGDRVAVLLGSDVPRGAEIAAAVIKMLVEQVIAPENVWLIRPPSSHSSRNWNPLEFLPSDLAEKISLIEHNPDRLDHLCYLAADEKGEPIVLNRRIIDADMVIPIARVRPPRAPAHYGVHSAIYPTYSDRRTLESFHSLDRLDTQGRARKSAVKAVAQVAWLLGVNFTMQVIPGPGDEVVQVVAGHTGAAGRWAAKVYKAAWKWSIPRRAELVVATILGGREQQTWGNLLRAVAAALKAVRPGGTILLCTQLEECPPIVGEFAEQERLLWEEELNCSLRSYTQHEGRRLHEHFLDNALSQASIYLLSRLPADLVEQLGMVPVANCDEASRLVNRHRECIFLHSAPDLIVETQE